jgi:TolB-like protein
MNDVRPDPRRWVDLAKEPAFDLGAAIVRPSACEVAAGGRTVRLQARVMQVLVALARADGDFVSRSALIESCWGGLAVGDDAINRCIQRLRRLAEQEAPDCFAIETIPRIGYRLRVRSPAAVAAHHPRQAPCPSDPAPPLLAVLPFDNLSNDAELLYFSDGVSEEILQTVSRTTELTVIGRSSSFQFRGAKKAAQHIAGELRCTHVLDGSVRCSGARVRVAAQLIECATETTLWSESFDRDLSDIFALQDEIAAAVTAALKTAFAAPAQSEAIDPAVYRLYLQARAMLQDNSNLIGMVQALGMLEGVVAEAPGFARAWASLAEGRAFCFRYRDRNRIPNLTRANAVEAATTALRLDPALAIAYIALERLEAYAHYGEREAWCEKALAAAPNDPEILKHVAGMVAHLGRCQEALGHSRKAMAGDRSPAALQYPNFLDRVGRYQEARDLLDELLARWPTHESIVGVAMSTAVGNDDWDWFEAIAQGWRQRGVESEPMRVVVRFWTKVRTPDRQYAADFLDDVRKIVSQTGTAPLQHFTSLYALGFREEAFELIEQVSYAHLLDPEGQSPNAGAAVSPGVIYESWNRPMRCDIRFVGLCAKLGLCDYWVKSGKWPDCADEVVYDFRAEARRLARAVTV